MSCARKFVFVITVAMVVVCASAAQSAAPASQNADFAPFQQWMGAILTGEAAALKGLYSTNPPADVQINAAKSDAEADINYWLSLKPSSMKVDVVRNEPRHGHISFIFRATVGLPNGQTISLTDDQSWQQQGNEWKLISVERTDAPRLAQASSMKKDLYPANTDAHAEIKEAEERAAREHKRIL